MQGARPGHLPVLFRIVPPVERLTGAAATVVGVRGRVSGSGTGCSRVTADVFG